MLSFRPLLLLLCLRPVLGWRSFDVDFTGYRCEIVDPTVMTTADLRLVSLNNHHALNGTVVFGKDVRQFVVEGKLTLMRHQQEPVEIVNTLLDGCGTLESRFGPKTHIVAKWVMREIRAMNSTFPEHCPILKDQKIVFNNFALDPERLPAYLMDLNMRIQVHVLMGRRYIFKSFFNASIFAVGSGDRPKKTKLRKTSTG